MTKLYNNAQLKILRRPGRMRCKSSSVSTHVIPIRRFCDGHGGEDPWSSFLDLYTAALILRLLSCSALPTRKNTTSLDARVELNGGGRGKVLRSSTIPKEKHAEVAMKIVSIFNRYNTISSCFLGNIIISFVPSIQQAQHVLTCYLPDSLHSVTMETPELKCHFGK